MNFWQNVDAQLDHIEKVKPNTAWHVIQIMNEYRTDYGMSSGEAFFEGSGGDRQLLGSLIKSGWHLDEMEAVYYYTAKHPSTGEIITYVEGDVFAGDQMLR